MKQQQILEFINNFWGVIVTIAGGIGGFFAWQTQRKKDQLQLQQTEKQQQLEIEQQQLEIEQARVQLDKEKKEIDSSFETSTEMLYKQLEELKQKVVLQVAKEVKQAQQLAEKQAIIIGLKNHCPECFTAYMKQYKNEYSN